jgi:hypothetical protein
VYALVSAGIGGRISELGGVELLINGGFSPNKNNSAALGAGLGFYFNLGKRNTEEKNFFFQGI